MQAGGEMDFDALACRKCDGLVTCAESIAGSWWTWENEPTPKSKEYVLWKGRPMYTNESVKPGDIVPQGGTYMLLRKDGNTYVRLDRDLECKRKDSALLYFKRKYYRLLQNSSAETGADIQRELKRVQEVIDALV